MHQSSKQLNFFRIFMSRFYLKEAYFKWQVECMAGTSHLSRLKCVKAVSEYIAHLLRLVLVMNFNSQDLSFYI